jgi:hypothetical protein
MSSEFGVKTFIFSLSNLQSVIPACGRQAKYAIVSYISPL